MDAVEEVKSRLSIEDVVGQYVQLKKAGRNYKALSPFSNEKTASFMVSPEKQIWHDFSSGKGGNIFSIVMEMEGVDFKTALDILSRKAGVDLDKYQKSSSGSSKTRQELYELNEWAAKYYQRQLLKNKTAWDYLSKKRGFSKQTIIDFRIGFAAQNEQLDKFLKTKNFNEQIISNSGLAGRRSGTTRDMFNERIIIPLSDSQGKIVGFTSRLLKDIPNAPKYINTPQTLLYDKSRNIFGLNLAKESIRKNNYVVVVEGNLDVITSHQAGVKNVVATAGTAITKMHLKTLNNFSQDIRIAFDNDYAGQNATERAIEIASQAGINLSIVEINNSKDPDELIKKDPNAWKKCISKPVYSMDWLINRYQKIYDINSALGKKQFSNVIGKALANLNDEVELDHYLSITAKLLNIDKDALKSKIKIPESVRLKSIKPQETNKDSQSTQDIVKIQNNLLALIINKPTLKDYLKYIEVDILLGEEPQNMLKILKKSDQETIKQNIKSLQKTSDYGKMLSLLFEELYQNLEINELRYEAARLQVRLVEKYVKIKKDELSYEMKIVPDKKIDSLLQKAKKLDQLLKHAKEIS